MRYQEEEKRQSSRPISIPHSGSSFKGHTTVDNKLKAPSKPMPKVNRTSSIELADDEYEKNLYKPRQIQPSRRRQKAEEVLLNEIFENVIDSCIKQDRHKIFSAPVKSKDAPRYYEVIHDPIDLGTMKNKAKRSEYYTRDEIASDFELLRSNAELYNGAASTIA